MKLTVGVLAHVDAGKTTFSQQALYQTGAIRTLGRVDHQDTFLDTDTVERRHGITVFSGLARFTVGDTVFQWLDTPGHMDFSPEMERAVSVMDAAILIVSAASGIQSHTETLWRILEHYHCPVFLFLNKCDLEGADPQKVFRQLQARFSSEMMDCRLFQQTGQLDFQLIEEIASRDETLLDRYLQNDLDEAICLSAFRKMISKRQCFPVFSGSALKGEGILSTLKAVSALSADLYTDKENAAPSGKIFRVRHDAQGARLCFIKLTAGILHIRDELSICEDKYKINELRMYHGNKYRSLQSVSAGDIVAIPGLENIHPGDCFGYCPSVAFQTEPMLSVELVWERESIPFYKMSGIMAMLQDEEPTLGVTEQGERIFLHIMGTIQLDILREILKDRYGVSVSFGPQKVLYKETIAEPVIGIGHYEPLRHYAEVHLRLIPGEPGSGIRFRSLAHVDQLALNWQRLIETHIFQKQHKGVLTGSPLTDVTIELLCGKDHLKHTEGGDFRQATYRGIRNALMQAKNVLLEPICGFEMMISDTQYGTMLGALSSMNAVFESHTMSNEMMQLQGEAPFADFAAWQPQFPVITHGYGTLRVWLSRYAPCRNAEKVISAEGYNPLANIEDTPDSVFCAHGAGFNVAWNKVADFAHLSHEEYLG